MIGKLPLDMLERLVLRKKGAHSPKVVVGPMAGVDVGVVESGGKYLVSSTDPITGAEERVGWLAVHISANDVATSGARPEYLLSTLLLPERIGEEGIAKIAEEMDRAAKELGISILGGHTEITPGLKRPIVVATALGFTDRYVTSEMAKEGDIILMTKSAGIEGTAVIASSYRDVLKKMGYRFVSKAEALFHRISIVDEAVRAIKFTAVHAMHDPTEGGILGGVLEMAMASGLGFELYEASVPVEKTTLELARLLMIDPLRLLASGSLLIAVEPGGVEEVRSALQTFGVSEIGRFVGKGYTLIRKDGRKEELKGPVKDELWRIEELLG